MYPSVLDENNMSPPTQHGKILFPNKIDAKEDRFNNPYFDRSVWFVEDLISHNYLDFCHRYLNLATYEEMYDDILKFYTEICNSNRYPILYTENGKIMCHIVPDNKIGKELCIITNNKEKIMCKIVDKMPRRI